MTGPKAGTASPADALLTFQCDALPLFTIGSFDKNITVLSQQTRALNLAWSLVETKRVGTSAGTPGRQRIAIVGAGFAGLTLAAGLVKKRVDADITIFEKCDNVLPLQQGSDARWLHPHTYDWPAEASEAYSAALPVLNWTASRASDVVVQVLNAWRQVISRPPEKPARARTEPTEVQVYCNTTHLEVTAPTAPGESFTVEWIGEPRKPSDPALPKNARAHPVGESQPFDLVVMAVGFGLEVGSRESYWRNEALAQPQLTNANNTFIVSGSGDGALIDLFRLRIANFRQDRILAELFHDQTDVVERLRSLRAKDGAVTFKDLDDLWRDQALKVEAPLILGRLRDRLRQDTDVILQARHRSFAHLFGDKRVSFQNRLLAYLLYRSGGFTLRYAKDKDGLQEISRSTGVPDDRVVVRHGTDVKRALSDVLSEVPETWASALDQKNSGSTHSQSDVPAWKGGYFDAAGLREVEMSDKWNATTEKVKAHWRQEYLPSPMEGIATALCSAIAGYLLPYDPGRLRVTLHRTVHIGSETTLQQCCEYQGAAAGKAASAGRTFPATNATIGYAFSTQKVITTKRGATPEELQKDMYEGRLPEASKKMNPRVASVAAVPLLSTPATGAVHTVGVLYLDAFAPDFFDDARIETVARMCEGFLHAAPAMTGTRAGRISNTGFWRHTDPTRPASRTPKKSYSALRARDDIAPPLAIGLPQLNFDYSDFTQVEQP